MKTDFLGPAYKSRSLPLACQTAINLIFEPTQDGGGMYFVSPGMKPYLSLTGESCRGAIVAGGNAWFVIGTTLYRLGGAGSWGVIGAVPGVGRVSLVANESQLVVMHSSGWHVVTLSSLAYTAVPDSPTTAQGDYLGGRIYYPREDGTYGWTELNSASALDSLSFASAETMPDPVVAVVEDHGEMVIFGESTTEYGRESGDPELPIARTSTSEYGVLSRHSIAKSDLTLFWLGTNDKGDPRIYRREGYSPVGISDFAIDTWLASCDNLDEAFGFCFSQEGHNYYWFTVPGQKTFVYDTSTQRWSERAYRDPDTGDLRPHRASAHVYFGGKHLIGDSESGTIYEYDQETYTDDGNPLYFERTFRGAYQENAFVRYHSAELVAEMGVGLDGADEGADPHCVLSWSDNGGRLFAGNRFMQLGKIGEYQNRSRAMRLGMGRRRIYRISGATPVKVILHDVYLKAEPMSR